MTGCGFMHILIIGAGQLGSLLADALSQEDCQVSVMDQDRNALDRLAEGLDFTPLNMNGVEMNNLIKANPRNLDLAIAVTNDDETNMLISYFIKRLGCKHTIARVRNPEFASQSDYVSKEMEIDMIVNPDKATAEEMVCYLTDRVKRLRHIVIVGGGRIGFFIMESFTALGVRVMVIEIDHQRCKQLARQYDKALIINGDGTDLNLLKGEEVYNQDAFISVTGHDEENLILSLLAKHIKSKIVLCSVSRNSYIPIIQKLGIDLALNPVTITADRIMRFASNLF
jgi:Trk K+ transport system NAD-binding subunit